MSDRARLLAEHLRHRRLLGETEVFCEPGMREDILTRAESLTRKAGRGQATEAVTGVARVSTAASTAGSTIAAPLDRELERLAREGPTAEILGIEDLERLKAVSDACTRCGLHATRTRPVFADGSSEARVMCVGEAPGQKEDETGLPFVGRAGQLLDRLLASVGLGRSEVFICNVLKCRPPANRNPSPEEIESCSPFLRRQLSLVDPEMVIAFGTFAARTLLNANESLGRMRRQVHQYEGRPLVVTYHPAALLRNPGWIRPTWEDLQRVREILDDGSRAAPGDNHG
ncbi:MAG: uracil-DNA glycosylase [marine benthic group bacterium]|nr:uracil-DNA glycosylase [Gemmatimonadota bacterium]